MQIKTFYNLQDFDKYIASDDFIDIAYELSINLDTASVQSDLVREAVAGYIYRKWKK